MTLLDALAAALRDRLLAGHAVSMPGVGTLKRARVTARVEQQADGSSLLLPPSETVTFTTESAQDDGSLARALLRSLGTPSSDGPATLRQAIDLIEAHLAATGSARLPGIGTLHRSQESITFSADPTLLAAVAQPYEGMGPVSAQPSEPALPKSAPTSPAVPTDASFIDDATLDDDLDDVLAVPFETSDPAGLRAILPLTPDPSDASAPPDQDTPPADTTGALAAGLLGGAAAAAAHSTSSPPPRPETETTPPESPSETDAALTSLAPNELAKTSAVPPPPDAPDRAEAPDLGWLDDYEASDKEDSDADTAAVSGAAVAGAMAAGMAASPSPPLPKPPPIIAGPVDAPAQKRGMPTWLWIALPIVALAAAFFWYRATQTAEPSEPMATAEQAPEDDLARVALDTLTATTEATPPDSAAASPDDITATDTSATASPAESGAALDGEFTVEELAASGGAPASSTPARSGAAPPAETRPAATRAPQRSAATSSSGIDRPDLDGLSEADREALIGTAPIVSGRGGFSWVVLSTRDRAPADLRARQYRDAGWRVRVFQTEAVGDTVYRVAIGQFTSRDHADRLRSYLPSQVPTDTWRLDLSTL